MLLIVSIWFTFGLIRYKADAMRKDLQKKCTNADKFAESCADPRADVRAENMQMTRDSWLKVKVSKH